MKLKLTVEQLHAAKLTADRIRELEAEKDAAHSHHQVRVGDLFVPIPAAVIKDELSRQMTEHHAKLADLGIELI